MSFATYKVYVGVKTHYNSKGYNYWKENGRLNVSRDNFNARNDMYHFERMLKTYQYKTAIEQVCSTAFFYHNDWWIGDFFDESCREMLLRRMKFLQTPQQTIEAEIEKLFTYVDDGQKIQSLFACQNSLPKIMNLVKSKKVSNEVFTMLDAKFDFCKKFNDHTVNTKTLNGVIKSFQLSVYKNKLFLLPALQANNFDTTYLIDHAGAYLKKKMADYES